MARDASDTGTFEELAMPHLASLYRFACWLAEDRVAAEDLVQEAFVKAIKGFASYEQGTNFRAWIFRILRNAFLNSQAGMRTQVSLDDEESSAIEPAASDTPESMFMAQLQSEAIQSAIQQLPVHYREVILLCDLEEMSYSEIALSIGVPIGTVMSRLSRARRAMRTSLTEMRTEARR